ncbi:hypothetical protein GmRootV213_08470 [Variovorax sp. V213]
MANSSAPGTAGAFALSLGTERLPFKQSSLAAASNRSEIAQPCTGASQANPTP